MYNDRLSSEEARERIQQRLQEVESYSLNNRSGYDTSRIARWVIVFILLMVAVAVWLLF